MADPFTIYKTAILYLLDQAALPLSNAQLSLFFLEQEYTSFFRVQELLNDLQDHGLLLSRRTPRNTCYFLTPAGEETLRFSLDKLTDGIREDIDVFLKKYHHVQESTAHASYSLTPDKRYAVNCRLYSDDKLMLELTLAVNTQSQAEAVRANWESQSFEVYASLLDQLIR